MIRSVFLISILIEESIDRERYPDQGPRIHTWGTSGLVEKAGSFEPIDRERERADAGPPRYVVDLITVSSLGDARGDFWPDSIALSRIRWQRHPRIPRVAYSIVQSRDSRGYSPDAPRCVSPVLLLSLFPLFRAHYRIYGFTPVDRSRKSARGYLPLAVAGTRFNS